MKVVVTGANGFLAQHLCIHLAGNGHHCYAVSRGEQRIPAAERIHYTSLELTDFSSVNLYLAAVQPDVIVHVAAMSKPDECHYNRDACLLHNVQVTGSLAEAAKKGGSHLIYLSTDFIFGENGPHAEEDQPDPLNFYGESKLMGEKLVQQQSDNYTIVRPVFIYGPHWEGMRPGFIQWVRQNLQAGKTIRVVSDQLRTPTFANDICKGIEQIMLQKKLGVYHLAGKDILSPYSMALTVACVLGLEASLIEEVNSDSFPESVQRSRRSGLKIHKAIRELRYQPLSFEEGVRKSFAL
ncbi:MAG TPA: SDR family oxidoreductase [Sediminibacterium sp.]|nr:SDR family oxidoreductase [Sediminibacterium sp.]